MPGQRRGHLLGAAEGVGLALDDHQRHRYGGELARPGSSPAGPAGAGGRPAPARRPRPAPAAVRQATRAPALRPPSTSGPVSRPSSRSAASTAVQATSRRAGAGRDPLAGHPPRLVDPRAPASRPRRPPRRPRAGRRSRCPPPAPWPRTRVPRRAVARRCACGPGRAGCRSPARSREVRAARRPRRPRSAAAHVRRLVHRRVAALRPREPGAGEAGPLGAQDVPAVGGDQRGALRRRPHAPGRPEVDLPGGLPGADLLAGQAPLDQRA